MYNDYTSQSYYIKARANQFINEARMAHKAQEYRLGTEPKLESKQKKAFFSSFGTISNANTFVRHDI